MKSYKGNIDWIYFKAKSKLERIRKLNDFATMITPAWMILVAIIVIFIIIKCTDKSDWGLGIIFGVVFIVPPVSAIPTSITKFRLELKEDKFKFISRNVYERKWIEE